LTVDSQVEEDSLEVVTEGSLAAADFREEVVMMASMADR
jgi:hypothetical protein